MLTTRLKKTNTYKTRNYEGHIKDSIVRIIHIYIYIIYTSYIYIYTYIVHFPKQNDAFKTRIFYPR